MTTAENTQAAPYPWRRFFARTLDLTLYMLIWWIFAYLVLHIPVLNWTIRNAIISMILMLLIEPLLLALFGTTLGKFIFGIRILNENGKRLPYGSGFTRACHIFYSGYGFSIPIYNLVRLYKSYNICKEKGIMNWDVYGGWVCSVKARRLPLGACIYTLATALSIAVMVVIIPFSDMPRYRGNLTIAQLDANMNRYLRYHGIEWQMIDMVPTRPVDANVIWFPNLEQQFNIYVEETNGIVTEVRFEVINADWWFNPFQIDIWVRALAVSFIGAGEGMNFYRMHFSGGVLDNLFPILLYGNHRTEFTVAGVEIILNIDVSPNFDQINAYFNMRKL